MKLKNFFKSAVSTISITAGVLLMGLTVSANPANVVSNAVQNAWNAIFGEVRSIVDLVIFPAISVILSIMFFVSLTTQYFEYRKTGHFDFAKPGILLFGLVIAITAPLYIWAIVGR
jgi:hypothetical protein